MNLFAGEERDRLREIIAEAEMAGVAHHHQPGHPDYQPPTDMVSVEVAARIDEDLAGLGPWQDQPDFDDTETFPLNAFDH